MFSYKSDVEEDVNWSLTFSSFGKVLDIKTGRFHYGQTSSVSPTFTWTFDEIPECSSGCDGCGIIGASENQYHRKLPLRAFIDCNMITSPLNWKPAVSWTLQEEVDAFYCHYIHNEYQPFFTADLIAKSGACIVSVLNDDDKIIASSGTKKDTETAVSAALAVYNYLKDDEEYECRHYAIALHEVLNRIGFDASVEATWSTSADSHIWTEVIINGERHILDSFNLIFIRVADWEGPGCIYYEDKNKVGCSKDNIYDPNVSFEFECSTAPPGHGFESLPNGPFPKGRYFIADASKPRTVGWFDLLREREDGGVWDFYTGSPDIYCRGGFGFHEGTASDGCVTALRDDDGTDCFAKVKAFIHSFDKTYTPDRWQCHGCALGSCLKGDGESSMSSISVYSQIVLLSK